MKEYIKPELKVVMLSVENVLLESGLNQVEDAFGFGTDADERI